jgi:iron complex outermembrane receptor protein
LTHDGEFLGRDSEFVFGGGGDAQWQRRRGYQNFVGNALGVKGALRRDEKDDVDNLDVYAQWYWYFAEHWSLLLGMRHDKVHFNEHDFYITAKNPDDSGHVDYSATTPVLGILFHPRDNVQLYASFGRGFETPTYNELGYRSDGQPGLAFNLRASRSLNKEVGAKWQPTTALDVELAAFRADTRDELAVATNQNGRSTYQNVGAARRQGVELSANGTLAPEWQIAVGFTHLQAVFRSGFLTCTTTPCAAPSTPIPSGSRIPGVPENYGSLRLQHGAALGWREGVTLTGIGSVMANDTNTARAAGYGLIGADVTYAFALGASAHLQLSGRIDNLADRRYVGTVIVNDSNGRYYEPGPGRSYMLGAQLTF